MEAAFAGFDGVGELDFVAADVDAAPAHDALGVVADVVGVVVDDGQVGAGGLAVGLDVVFGKEPCEVGGFAEVDAGEEGLEGALAGAADAFAVGEEVLAGFDEGAAGGEELGLAGEGGVGSGWTGVGVSGLFDEAEAAVGGGGDVGVVAEGGDVNPELGGGVEDGGAGRHGDRTTINGERYRVDRRRHAESPAAFGSRLAYVTGLIGRVRASVRRSLTAVTGRRWTAGADVLALVEDEPEDVAHPNKGQQDHGDYDDDEDEAGVGLCSGGRWIGGRVEGQDGRCRDQEDRSADKGGQLTARHFRVRVQDLRARG